MKYSPRVRRSTVVLGMILAFCLSACSTQDEQVSGDGAVNSPGSDSSGGDPSGGASESVDLTASSVSVKAGSVVELSWSSSNVDSCTAEGGWTGDKPVSGSETVGPLETNTNFTITCSGAGGTVSDSLSVSVSAALPGNAIAAFELVDDASGIARGYTIGLPLPESVVASGSDLVVTKEDGTVVSSQWNELALWRTDNSVLHGALTFLTPDAGDNSGTYYIKVGTGHMGPSVTRADVALSGFDARVSASLAGQTYSLKVSDLLSGIVSPRHDYTHFEGPLATEFVVGGPLRQNGAGAEHNSLQAYFYIRAFNQPVASVYVTVVLENTGAFRALSDVLVENVDVTVGGSSLPGFPKSSFTAFADVRYQKRAWWNGDPGLWVRHDVEGVQDTRLVPEYRDIEINASSLGNYPQSTDWNQRAILSSAALDSGGAKPELAPYDRWTAAYLISGDRRAWNALRSAQDEYNAVVRSRSSAVSRPRDEETGLPIDIGNKGVISEEWGATGSPDTMLANRDGIPQSKTDLAHQPSIGYITYLLTAETSELESLMFSAIGAWVNERPGGYAGLIPNRRWGPAGQVRSIAWGFREVLNAGTATPSHHPLRNTMEGAVTNALREMSERGQPLDPGGQLGVWLTGPGYGVAVIYGAGSTPNPTDTGSGANDGVGYGPWQDDWLTWAIGSAYERGWKVELDASGFWAWKARSVVSRLGTSIASYCWNYAPVYALGVQDTSSGPFYSSWSQVFAKNFPDVTDCAASGGAMWDNDKSPTNYAVQIGPALAVAASTGIPGASSAWELYDQRNTSWGGGSFSSSPEWAITRR